VFGEKNCGYAKRNRGCRDIERQRVCRIDAGVFSNGVDAGEH
jgi:hypothetical protein